MLFSVDGIDEGVVRLVDEDDNTIFVTLQQCLPTIKEGDRVRLINGLYCTDIQETERAKARINSLLTKLTNRQ